MLILEHGILTLENKMGCPLLITCNFLSHVCTRTAKWNPHELRQWLLRMGKEGYALLMSFLGAFDWPLLGGRIADRMVPRRDALLFSAVTLLVDSRDGYCRKTSCFLLSPVSARAE